MVMSQFCFFERIAPNEVYTLSLHDALPICIQAEEPELPGDVLASRAVGPELLDRDVVQVAGPDYVRSEEHTSELQSRLHLVCRLLLEKKNTTPLSTLCTFSSLAYLLFQDET